MTTFSSHVLDVLVPGVAAAMPEHKVTDDCATGSPGSDLDLCVVSYFDDGCDLLLSSDMNGTAYGPVYFDLVFWCWKHDDEAGETVCSDSLFHFRASLEEVTVEWVMSIIPKLRHETNQLSRSGLPLGKLA